MFILFIPFIPLYYISVYCGRILSVVLGISGMIFIIASYVLKNTGTLSHADAKMMIACSFFAGILPALIITLIRIFVFTFGFNILGYLTGGLSNSYPSKMKFSNDQSILSGKSKRHPVSSGQLRILKNMLDSGEITEEEFNKKIDDLSKL